MNSKKKNSVRIVAVIGIVLLVALYVATLVVAIVDFPNADNLFKALLVADIGMPILLWIYMWMYKLAKERKAEAEALKEENEED